MALKDLMHKYVTYRNLIYLNMFGVFVGIVLIVSGLSAALVYCNDEGEANLYVLPSFKEDYKTYALQRLQDAGKFECGTYWRMQWGIWSLQTAWLIMLGFVLWYKMMPQYLHGLNSIATVCIAWHIWNAEDLLKLKPVTDDPLYTYGVVSFLGLMACIICDFFTIFCAGGLVHQQQQLQWREHDNGLFNGTGNGGRKVSKVEEVA